MSNIVLALRATAEAGVRKCEPFVAVTDCPSCGLVDHHGLKSVVDGFVPRVCDACGFVWHQFA